MGIHESRETKHDCSISSFVHKYLHILPVYLWNVEDAYLFIFLYR